MNQELVTDVREVTSSTLFNVGSTPISLGTLATMLVVIVVTFLLSRLLQSAVGRALRRRGVEPGRGGLGALGRLLHYILMFIGVAVALQTGGIKLSALFAAGAVFAVGIGFAMQNIAQNFVSGVILLVERTIKPGDILELDGTMVRITQMGIRTTLARTLDEEELIVPNSALVQGTIRNYSLGDHEYRLRVRVGVAYESDMERVEQVLATVANAHPNRDPAREPRVLLLDFGDSSVNWEVSVWITNPWDRVPEASTLRKAIWKAFKEERITIAFPQLDVHFDAPVVQTLQGLTAGRAASLPS
ncbi:MAG: mechanosensitive ion channel [Polyangiaceae bacterium]